MKHANKIWISISLVIGAALLTAALIPSARTSNPWVDETVSALAAIDREFEGDIGVYIKRLDDGSEVHYRSDQAWYLASTVKVFVGAAILRDVELGRVKLSDRVILRKSDFVDGSGEVIWKKPGAVLTIGYLFDKMLTQSDSTATDILVRRVGEDRLNEFIREHVGGTNRITTILQVRHDAYGEAHAKAARLTNLHFIDFKKHAPAKRLHAMAKVLKVKPSELRVSTLDEAFERYYAKGTNSGRLDAFGLFLEKLFSGKVLNGENTAKILSTMRAAETGKTRIRAGLAKGATFAQKTGTQVNRLCNVGMVGTQWIVTACVKNFKTMESGDAAFARVGQLLR